MMKQIFYLFLLLQSSFVHGAQCVDFFSSLPSFLTVEGIRPYVDLNILTFGTRRGQIQLNTFHPSERIRFFALLHSDREKYRRTARYEGETQRIDPGELAIYEKYIRDLQAKLFHTYLERKIVFQEDVDKMMFEPIDLKSKNSTWRFLQRTSSGETVASSQTIWESGKPLPLEKGENIVHGFKMELRRLFSDTDILDTVYWTGKMAHQDLFLGAIDVANENMDFAEELAENATIMATAVHGGAKLYSRNYGMTIVDPLRPETFPPSARSDKLKKLAESYSKETIPKFIVWTTGKKFWEVFHAIVYPRERRGHR